MNNAFPFHITATADGEIIDTHTCTPYASLTPLEMIQYIEVDSILATMEIQKRKESRQQRKRKIAFA